MKNYNDYRKLFGVQARIEQELKKLCRNVDHKSGIYFWTREEENEKFIYIGKSLDVLKRNVSHTQGYTQRLDISLRKRGFYSADNQLGWKLGVLYFPKEQLDEKERYYIEKYKQSGYTLYNIESGGTNGKEIIGDRQPPKTYRDGVTYGRKKLASDLAAIIDKYLVVSAKDDKVRTQKALEKFWKILNEAQK